MKPFISSKPYKQWCKARGINFAGWIAKYPHACRRLNIATPALVMPATPKATPQARKKSVAEKLKAFFKFNG